MSAHPQHVPADSNTDRPWYRAERWFVVQLLAFVPTLAAFLLPRELRLPLFALGGALVAIGALMLLRLELRRPSRRPRVDVDAA